MVNGNRKEKVKIAIIGGGVSGVAAALTLPSSYQIDIFERENRLLKKLLKTGNGRANIFNIHIGEDDYNNSSFFALHPHIVALVEKFYLDQGILCFTDEAGRGYPYSRSAKTLANNLSSRLGPNTTIYLDTSVSRVEPQTQGFLVDGKHYDKVIITTGSSAYYPHFNLANNNDHLLTALGLATTKFYPTSGPLMIEENLQRIENEKVKALLTITKANRVLTSEDGEILFKRDSLSGIASFIAHSRLVWDYRKEKSSDYVAHLNLINGDEERVFKLIEHRKMNGRVLEGIFSEALNDYLALRLDKNFKVADVMALLTDVRFNIRPNFFLTQERGQIMSGGVKVEQINPHTFATIKNSNLYLGGEVLDIDGVSGGYNLMFALYSALVIAKDIIDKRC